MRASLGCEWMRFSRLWRDQRGNITIVTALSVPVCAGVMAFGVDVSRWAVTRVELQRIADTAAMAGAMRYAETDNAAAGVTTAANVAELNGVPAGTRTGTGSESVTDDYGSWTASFSANTDAHTITATVQTAAPIWFGRIFTTATEQPVSATAVAWAKQRHSGNGACVLALKGESTGITTYVDVTISGHTSVSSSTCGVQSDGSLTVSGSATIAVPSVITSGSISLSGNASIKCPSSSPCSAAAQPQIPDPFSALYGSQLAIPSGGTATQSGTTLNPGVYASGLSFNGNNSYTLNPGVYYVRGSIAISGNATVSGTGVTLISSDGISFSGNSTVNLSAPTSGPTAGLLYGTSTTNGTVSFSGNSANVMNGAIYAPNANASVTGNSTAFTTQSSCTAIVAATISFSGNSNFNNSGCNDYGVPTIYAQSAKALLIQ
jgi:Flp pilus assembly protein TadG